MKRLILTIVAAITLAISAKAEQGVEYDRNGYPVFSWKVDNQDLGNGAWQHYWTISPLVYHIYFHDVTCNGSRAYYLNIFYGHLFTFRYIDDTPDANWAERYTYYK